MKTTLIYLATPYSDPNHDIREMRFTLVSHVAGVLMKAGNHVFSPISHTHPIGCACDMPTDWEFWRKFDEVMLRKCDVLVVLKLKGCEHSIGVKGEIEIAKSLGMPIFFTTYEKPLQFSSEA